MDSLGLPIHSGYYIEDLRALPLGRWEERGCDAAFIQLEGQQGITETRVSEVPPRGVLPPVRLAFDEVVYVVQGRGATTIWDARRRAQELRVAAKTACSCCRAITSTSSATRTARARRGCCTTTTSRCCCRPARIADAFITTRSGDAGEPVHERRPRGAVRRAVAQDDQTRRT